MSFFKKSAILVFVVFIFVLASCNESNTVSISKYKNLLVKEVVNELDRTNPKGISASINGLKLVMSDENDYAEFDLPEDEFYLSFAPYINSTHPCANHNLATCRGELTSKKISYEVVDDDGNIILSDTVTTFKNGFYGIWLPRYIDATITVTYNNKVATASISTFDDSDTCLTTPLKLQ